MTSPADNTGAGADDDVLLTAWLDGELAPADRVALDHRLAGEPALAARLDHLRSSQREFGPAYEALLAAAPAERLNAMLSAATASRPHRAPDAGAPTARRWMAIAAALVLFAAGAAAGYVAHMMTPPPYKGWRQVVAEYHALISPETVALIREDPSALAMELASVGEHLSLDLSSTTIALPDADLKRVQLYDYHDRPLAQLVFMSTDRGPIALCIIANGREDEAPEFEQREGSNIVYWSKGGRGYLLIAKDAPRADLERYAGEIAARLS